MSRPPIVEVSVTGTDGERVAIGLMTAHQALSLPEHVPFEASHPDHEPGATDVLLDRGTLQAHVDGSPSNS
ncbi:hypothetical protein [Neorhizobium alkalisoli]|uniref:Uncharacterized protein n=1 Tax=Neorhizobium alkalisoli TaxID=528178 RepID=A0A561PYZ0_9HYPH|nr:hypothetical protein [Neorhizobium alkalisoli]TWF43341.1 hypothetical protein FHW37_12111 [Neorhizobium alkalisoli]